MKKIFFLFIIMLIFSACNKGDSGSADTSFKITPGTVAKFDSPVNTSTVDIDSAAYSASYGIIKNISVVGSTYTCLAISNNPDPGSETFNMKIYFPETTIPSTKDIISGGNAVVKITINGTAYSELSGGTITLNFASDASDQITETHGDSDSSNDTVYTRYHITSSGSIGVGSLTLSNLNITALKVL